MRNWQMKIDCHGRSEGKVQWLEQIPKCSTSQAGEYLHIVVAGVRDIKMFLCMHIYTITFYWCISCAFCWCRSPVTLQISCIFIRILASNWHALRSAFLGVILLFFHQPQPFPPPKKNSFVRLPTRPTENTWGSRNSPTWPKECRNFQRISTNQVVLSENHPGPNLLPLWMLFLETKATNCNRWISGRFQQTQPSKNHCRIWDPNISLNVVVGPCNLVFQPGVPIAEYLADNIKTMMTRKNALVPKKMEIRSTYSEATSDVVVCK